MSIFRPFVVFALSVLAAAPARAQTPPSASGEEDLEVPAGPAPLAPQAPPMNPTVDAPAAPPSAAATESEREGVEQLRREVAALRARLDALPAGPRIPAPALAAKPRAKTVGPLPNANLERRAHSRPVPLGFRLGGYVQAQYETNQLSESQLDQNGAPLNLDRFVLRRARLRLDRGFQYAAATLELDANTLRGPSVGIRRAEAALLYRPLKDPDGAPLVSLAVGIIDLPFGYELLESARVRPFLERSNGSLALFPTEMDAGIKIAGALSFLRYGLSLSNGQPLDSRGFPSDPNRAKDVTGRVGADLTPLPSVGVAGGTSFVVGKGFHPGRAAEKNSLSWRDDDEDFQIDSGEIIAVPGSAATRSRDFSRWVLGLDLQLRLTTPLGDTRLLVEGFVASNHDRGLVASDPIVTGFDVRQAGGYVAIVQQLGQYGLVGFRYSSYDPNSDFFDSRRGNLLPLSLGTRTFSPLLGLELRDRARLVLQYDFVSDHFARDRGGVPTDAANDQFAARLQVEL